MDRTSRHSAGDVQLLFGAVPVSAPTIALGAAALGGQQINTLLNGIGVVLAVNQAAIQHLLQMSQIMQNFEKNDDGAMQIPGWCGPRPVQLLAFNTYSEGDPP